MKKTLVFTMVFCCAFLALRGFAADADPENVSVSLLREWASEKYGCKIDNDGDLVLNTKNGKMFVSVIGKAKTIRLFCLYSPYRKRSREEMIQLANKFNFEKRLLRVCISEKGNQILDYYIIYDGGLNSGNFLEALNWFTVLESAWNDYVVNGGNRD